MEHRILPNEKRTNLSPFFEAAFIILPISVACWAGLALLGWWAMGGPMPW